MVHALGRRPAVGGISLAWAAPVHATCPFVVPTTRIFRNRATKQEPAAPLFCAECGYELATDSDGTCPICPRLAQIRMRVPEPPDRAAQRARPSSAVRPQAGVIRNRALRGGLSLEVSTRDGASDGSDAAEPSRQHRTGEHTGVPIILPTTPAADESLPTPDEPRVHPGDELRHPAPRSSAGWKLGPTAIIALFDLFLIGALIEVAMPTLLPLMR